MHCHITVWLLFCSGCLAVVFFPSFSSFCLSWCLCPIPLCSPELLIPLWFSVKWAKGSASSLKPCIMLPFYLCHQNDFLLFLLLVSGSMMASPMSYISLAGWGLASFLGTKKQGLKTEDQKLSFRIPVYDFQKGFQKWLTSGTTSENPTVTYGVRLRDVVFKFINFLCPGRVFPELMPICKCILESSLQKWHEALSEMS